MVWSGERMWWFLCGMSTVMGDDGRSWRALVGVGGDGMILLKPEVVIRCQGADGSAWGLRMTHSGTVRSRALVCAAWHYLVDLAVVEA